jgi:hypothetical protein
MSVQQQMAQLNQMQATTAAMMSAPAVGQMSPQGLMAQQAYMYAAQNMGTAGFNMPAATTMGGMPSINPYAQPHPGYTPPMGYIPGPASDQFYRPGIMGPLVHDLQMRAGRMIGGSGFAQTGIGQFLGLPGLGTYGAGARLDQPVYRTQQAVSEALAEEMHDVKMLALKNVPSSAMYAGAGAAATMLPGIGLPIAGALMAGGAIYDRTVGELVGDMEGYRTMGRYARDMMAPQMRERIGGGMNYQSMANFQRGMGQMVGGDRFFTQQDYAQLMELGADRGLFQLANNTDQLLQNIDNLSKSFKGILAVGTKMKDVSATVDALTSLGINAAGNPGQVTGFMGQLAMSAFSGGVTQEALRGQMVQAGNMFQAQGIGANVGAQIHMRNVAQVGEAIRSGAFSFSQVQYYGGRENMANLLSQGQAALNRTPLGEMGIIGMLRDPSMIGRMARGEVDMTDVIQSSMGGIDPSQYYNIRYRMPELTRELDPNALRMGQMASHMNAFRKMRGLGPDEKINTGEFYAYLTTAAGGEEPARMMLNSLENASATKDATMESIQDQAIRFQAENARREANVLQNFSNWRQNRKEQYLAEWTADWSASATESVGRTYKKRMKDNAGNLVMDVNDQLVGMDAIRDSIIATVTTEGPSAREQVEEDLRQRKLDIINKDASRAKRFMGVQVYGGREGLNRTDVALAQAVNERAAGLGTIATLAGQATVSGPYAGTYGVSGLDDPIRGGVSREDLNKAIQRVTNSGVASAEDEKLITSGFANGLISPQQLKSLRGAAAITDEDRLRAYDIRQETARTDAFIGRGYSGQLDQDQRQEVVRIMGGMSNEERREAMDRLQLAGQRGGGAFNKALGQIVFGQDIEQMTSEQASIAGAVLNEMVEIEGGTRGGIKRFFEGESEKQKQARELGNYAEDLVKGSTDSRRELLKEYDKEASKTGERFSTIFKDLTGFGITSESSETISFATSALQYEELSFLKSNPKALQQAIKTGSIRDALSEEDKKKYDEIMSKYPNKADAAGEVQELLGKATTEGFANLDRQMTDDKDLQKLAAKIRKGYQKKRTSMEKSAGSVREGTSGGLGSRLKGALSLGEQYSTALGKKRAIVGEMTQEQAIRMATLLGGDTAAGQKTVRDALTKMRKGDMTAEELFSELKGVEGIEGFGELGQEFSKLLEGESIDTEKLKMQAAQTLGIDTKDTEAMESLNTLIKAASFQEGMGGLEGQKRALKDTELAQELFNMFSEGKTAAAAGIMGGGTSGYLTDKQMEALDKQLKASEASAQLAEQLGNQLTEVPKSLEASAALLKEAFGTRGDPSSHAGTIDSNTKALQNLTNKIGGLGQAIHDIVRDK